MKNKQHYLLVLALASLVLTGCSSSDNDSGSDSSNSDNGSGSDSSYGDNSGSNTASLNKNPARITKDNAPAMVENVTESLSFLDLFFDLELPGVDFSSTEKVTANTQTAWTFKQLKKLSENLVTTAETNNTSINEACIGGGSMNIDIISTGTELNGTTKIVANYSKCNSAYGYYPDFILDGKITMDIVSSYNLGVEKFSFNYKMNNLSLIDNSNYMDAYFNGGMRGNCEESDFIDNCSYQTDYFEVNQGNEWVKLFDTKIIEKDSYGFETLTADYKINSNNFAGMLSLKTLEQLEFNKFDAVEKGKVKIGSDNNYALLTYKVNPIDPFSELVDIEVNYSGGSCFANDVTESELEEGGWVCK